MKKRKMKNILKLLFAIAVIVSFYGCSSDEPVNPVHVEDDLRTSANLYEDQFLTFKITTNFDQGFKFYLGGNGGKVSINWGDGTIEKKVIDGEYIMFDHVYSREKNYTINVSGDLATITAIDMAYRDLLINHIHFGGLTNLEQVNFNLIKIQGAVNFSRNKKLQVVHLLGVQGMTDVILSTTNNITQLNISGDNSLTTPSVDRIIARIHDSVINNPRQGSMTLSKTWYQDEEDTSMVGPPSSYSINKLRKLQNTYGWNISPDVD
jgi:hypothetical protein